MTLRNRAFTLIELLVVIAIIAILASILFPVFAQAKSSAKKIASLSNVKNIGLGVHMYTTDYDDILPQCQYWMKDNPDPQVTWLGMIYPYIKNGSTWGANKNVGGGGIWTSPGDPAPQQGPSSYAIHYDLARDGAAEWTNWAVPPTFSITQIEDFTNKVYIIERGVNAGAGNWLQFTPWEWDWTDWVGHDSTDTTINPNPARFDLEPGRGDCDYSYDPSDWTVSYDGSTWGKCGMLPRYRYNRSTPVVFLDGHARTFNRTEKGSGLSWYKNIFVREAFPSDWASWYPY